VNLNKGEIRGVNNRGCFHLTNILYKIRKKIKNVWQLEQGVDKGCPVALGIKKHNVPSLLLIASDIHTCSE